MNKTSEPLQKRCSKCKIVKPVSEFSLNRRKKIGLQSWCKSCIRVVAVKYVRLPSVIAHRKKYLKEWHAKHPGKAAQYQAAKRPEPKSRSKAREAFKSAKKYGKIKSLPCVKCGNPKSEGHHHDYSKPLDVTWLCRKHHAELHRLERDKLCANNANN